MTLKDKETIQRALGIIEGVVCGMEGAAADMLTSAVEMIDGVLEKKGAELQPGITPLQPGMPLAPDFWWGTTPPYQGPTDTNLVTDRPVQISKEF